MDCKSVANHCQWIVHHCTVAHKTVPMFGCFGQKDLAWSDDIICGSEIYVQQTTPSWLYRTPSYLPLDFPTSQIWKSKGLTSKGLRKKVFHPLNSCGILLPAASKPSWTNTMISMMLVSDFIRRPKKKKKKDN